MAESAVILTVGDEIVSGDVENTNASWLARRLGELGVEVRLLAAVRDDIQAIATFLRAERDLATHVFVTGGLGGTPDDLTREARGRSLRGALQGDRLARGRAPRALLPPGSRRLRRSLGLPAGGGRADPESARRRPGVRARERLRPAGPAQRDGGDVRGARRALRRLADRELAPPLPDRRGPDRGDPGGGDRPPSRGDGRELPALPRDRARGRGRPEVERRGRARRRRRVRRDGARRRRSGELRARAPAPPRSRRGARPRGGSTGASRRETGRRAGRRSRGTTPRSRSRPRSAPSPSRRSRRS